MNSRFARLDSLAINTSALGLRLEIGDSLGQSARIGA
jgi:hypothetical protein